MTTGASSTTARMVRHPATVWRGVLVAAMAAGAVGVFDAQAFVGRQAPELTDTGWINSSPVSIWALRGSVVLVEFWTFGCFNCRNVEPQVKAWHQAYVDRGLVVVGVHSPEFAYEKDVDAVTRYVTDHHIPYAVAIDNDFSIWNRYGNHYWPAMYLIDKRGVIRYVRVGEGGYAETERMIETLLAETSE
ncbi:MAG: redoxin domain-containing protein [Nitrospirae bacterium]|nr:redoxin domain-containing protein [Nitrospirota bacterium]